MTHDPKTAGRLSAYLDGALSPGERAVVEALLARDAAARKLLQDLKTLRNDLLGISPAAPPEAFYARVWRDIDAPPRRAFWAFAPVKAVGALAAAALVVVATHDFWRSPAARQAKMSELAQRAPSPIQMFQAPLEAKQSIRRDAPASSVDESRTQLARKAYDKKAAAPQAVLMDKVERAGAKNEVSALEKDMKLDSLGAGAGARMKSMAAPQIRGAAGGALSAPAAPAAVEPGPVFQRDWRGEDSRLTAFETVAIRSASDWMALWDRHAPGKRAPAVDFTRWMVVGVFAGQRSSGVQIVTIIDAFPARNSFRVSYTITSPPPGAAVTQALTSSYHLVLVPVSHLPVEFVSY